MAGETIGVYVDFDNDGSFATAGDDISDYVKSIDGLLGMRDDTQHIARAGNASVTLHNANRQFSPAYSSGTYYGKLLPGLPVKIDVTPDGGSTYTVFRGYTESWQPISGHIHGSREVLLSCVDVLDKLQRAQIALPLQENETADVVAKKVLATALNGSVADIVLEFMGDPSDSDTIAIGGTTYTLVSGAVSSADEVLIETGTLADVKLTARNLTRAINADLGSGSNYGAGTTRHAKVTAQGHAGFRFDHDGVDTDILLQESTDSYERLAGFFFWLYDADLPDGPVEHDHIWLRLKKVGSPAGTLTVRIEGSWNATPSGSLVDANATGTYDEADLTTSYAWHRIDFADDVEFEQRRRYWVVLSTDRATSGTDYVAWGGNSTVTATFKAWRDYKSSTWSTHTNVGLVLALADRVEITANAAGTWGNSITVAADFEDVAFDGVAQEGDGTPSTTLTGGGDALSGLTSWDTGKQTIELAGDTWEFNKTTGYEALRDLAMSEFGYVYVTKDGTFTFKNREWLFKRQTVAASMSVGDESEIVETDISLHRVRNVVTVRYIPRGEASVGTVARANYVIMLPGGVKNSSWNPTEVEETRRGSVDIPYIELATGTIAGAKDLITPVAGTDYDVYSDSDGTSETFNSDVIVSLAIAGGKVRANFTNKSNAKRYVHGFKVRGTALITYEEQRVVAQNSTSVSEYDRLHMSYVVPFASDFTFAESIAEYLKGRYSNVVANRVYGLVFTGVTEVDGTNLWGLDIGDTIEITETQTGITDAKLLIIGYQFSWDFARGANIHIFTRPLSDSSYWILGDATYGRLGDTTRLSLGGGAPLLDPMTWNDGDLVGASDLNSDIRDNLQHIYTNVPKRAMLWHDESTVTAGNAITSTTDNDQRYNITSYQNAAALNDEFTNGCWLRRGNYEFGFLYTGDSDGGEGTMYIDDNLFYVLDTYQAVTTRSANEIAGIFIEDTGWHTLKIKCTGQNVASSGYKLQFTKFWFNPALGD